MHRGSASKAIHVAPATALRDDGAAKVPGDCRAARLADKDVSGAFESTEPDLAITIQPDLAAAQARSCAAVTTSEAKERAVA